MEYKFCVPCLLGLEGPISDELKRLDMANVASENGRVYFTGGDEALARANICLRIGERVLIEMGRFDAFTFDELFEGTKALPWESIIPKDGAFPVKGYSLNSKLFSVSDCQKIIKKAVVERLKKSYGLEWFPETGLLLHRQSDDDHGEGIQRILHHIRGNGICLRYRGRGDWQHDGGMGVQTHHGLAAQIHHLCLYRHQRTDFPAGGIAAIHYGRTTIPSIYMHLTQKNCY